MHQRPPHVRVGGPIRPLLPASSGGRSAAASQSRGRDQARPGPPPGTCSPQRPPNPGIWRRWRNGLRRGGGAGRRPAPRRRARAAGLGRGTLGGRTSRARGIDNAGRVVGFSNTVSGATHAFLWTEEVGMLDLGVLSGDISQAEATNRTWIVGGSETASGERHAVRWRHP